MLLFVLAYLGGVLTIVSPCILPVLPFVFARAGQPFLRSGLPMLLGMAVSFALVASLAAVAGGWAVAANQYGRLAALVLLALFGLALLIPSLAEKATAPLVALGGRLSQSSEGSGVFGSALLGVATGLLWAPCAGPVLGLILTGAALNGANVGTSLLLLAYAAGAATSLAAALLVGGRVFAAMKRSLGIGEWMRRGLGALVLVAVGAIALGLDTGFLTRVSLAGTNALEQGLIDRLNPPPAGGPAMMSGNPAMTGDAPAMMSANPAMTGGAPGHDRRQPRDDGGQQPRHDERQSGDDGQARRYSRRGRGACRPAGRGHAALAQWRHGLAQLAPADRRGTQGQGRADRLLDLFLHQLPARHSLCPGLGGEVQGSGAGGDRRAFARIRLRARRRQRQEGGRRPQDRLPRRHRQRLRHLARLQEPVLAGALLHRRRGPHPPPPFRRGRLRPVRAA